MAIDYTQSALPKQECRKRVKARSNRRASTVMQHVHEDVASRDTYCRLYWFDAATRSAISAIFGACSGRAEMAHIGEKRRSKTVGQDAEERHVTTHAVLLCHRHHQGDNRYSYDRHAFEIEALSKNGCDGRLRFVRADGQIWEEPNV